MGIMRRCIVVGGVELRDCVREGMIVEKGLELGEGETGIKVIEPGETVRRLVRSKLWVNVAGVVGSVCPLTGDIGPRFGVGGAVTIS